MMDHTQWAVFSPLWPPSHLQCVSALKLISWWIKSCHSFHERKLEKVQRRGKVRIRCYMVSGGRVALSSVMCRFTCAMETSVRMVQCFYAPKFPPVSL